MEMIASANTVGCRARGVASEGPFSHATGAGWVRPRPGCYRDAIVVKRHKLRLLIADPHGGVTRSTHMWLSSLGKRARVGRDATVYGAHSPRVFATHHALAPRRLSICRTRVCARGEADAFQKEGPRSAPLSALTRPVIKQHRRHAPCAAVILHRLARRPISWLRCFLLLQPITGNACAKRQLMTTASSRTEWSQP